MLKFVAQANAPKADKPVMTAGEALDGLAAAGLYVKHVEMSHHAQEMVTVQLALEVDPKCAQAMTGLWEWVKLHSFYGKKL